MQICGSRIAPVPLRVSATTATDNRQFPPGMRRAPETHLTMPRTLAGLPGMAYICGN